MNVYGYLPHKASHPYPSPKERGSNRFQVCRPGPSRYHSILITIERRTPDFHPRIKIATGLKNQCQPQ